MKTNLLLAAMATALSTAQASISPPWPETPHTMEEIAENETLREGEDAEPPKLLEFHPFEDYLPHSPEQKQCPAGDSTSEQESGEESGESGEESDKSGEEESGEESEELLYVV